MESGVALFFLLLFSLDDPRGQGELAAEGVF